MKNKKAFLYPLAMAILVFFLCVGGLIFWLSHDANAKDTTFQTIDKVKGDTKNLDNLSKPTNNTNYTAENKNAVVAENGK